MPASHIPQRVTTKCIENPTAVRAYWKMQSEALAERFLGDHRLRGSEIKCWVRGYCPSESFALPYNLEEKDHDAWSIFLHSLRQTASQASGPQYTSLLLSVWPAIIVSLYRIDAHTTSSSILFIHFSVHESIGIGVNFLKLIFCKILEVVLEVASCQLSGGSITFGGSHRLNLPQHTLVPASDQSYWLPIT